MNIVLTGFMATGKTEISKAISEISKYNLVDTDDMIVEQEGITINEIFDKCGEEYFRKTECEVIKKAAENADYCLMIENGSALLAQTGMLYRRKIADFPMDANWNRMFTAGIERVENARVVIDGKFYSCSSSMAGIDTALWVAADILDISAAEKAAGQMGYSWNENADEDIYC